MIDLKKFLFVTSLCFAIQAIAGTQVNVVGLFNNKALLMINGSGPHSLRAGQTKSGVKLIAANSNSATLIIEGKRQVLGMGQAASVGSSSTNANSERGINKPVHLYADSRGHFFGNLMVNGTSLKYLVDSGATTVAMNSGDAKYAGIDYEKGNKSRASTANGVVDVYLVKLNTLKIGTIVLHNVQASVIEGGSPAYVLLGMSVQNRLKMTRNGSTLTMTKKF